MWVIRTLLRDGYLYLAYESSTFRFGLARKFMFKEIAKKELDGHYHYLSYLREQAQLAHSKHATMTEEQAQQLDTTWEIIHSDEARRQAEIVRKHKNKLRQSGNEVW